MKATTLTACARHGLLLSVKTTWSLNIMWALFSFAHVDATEESVNHLVPTLWPSTPPTVPSSDECYDVTGVAVASGHNYVPGPDYCSVCLCEGGHPRFCRAVLCQPRQDCRSFRVGATCCDFICLDDVLPNMPGDGGVGGGGWPGGPGNEVGENSLGVRLAAAILTALMAFVLLLFLVHRLRQRQLAAGQLAFQQDAIACCGGYSNSAAAAAAAAAAYWHASDQAQLFLQGTPGPPHLPPSHSSAWKPHHHHHARDAPPPYSEADALRAARQAAEVHSMEGLGQNAGVGFNGGGGVGGSGSGGSGSGGGGGAGLGFNGGIGGGGGGAGQGHVSHISYTGYREVEDDGGGGGGGSGGRGGGAPANVGPLAVQLLPTATDLNCSGDLRQQIQRQRQALNTRVLPRPATDQPTSAVEAIEEERHFFLGEARIVVAGVDEDRDEGCSLDGTLQHNYNPLQHGRRSRHINEDQDTNHVASVRQSVLRFEAVAVLEAVDVLSQHSTSPCVLPRFNRSQSPPHHSSGASAHQASLRHLSPKHASPHHNALNYTSSHHEAPHHGAPHHRAPHHGSLHHEVPHNEATHNVATHDTIV